jgi:hypothetical protein
MKKSPADEGDASRLLRKALWRALLPTLWQNIGGLARLAGLVCGHKKGPLARTSFESIAVVSSVMMMMTAMVVMKVPTGVLGPDRDQLDADDAGRNVQSSLALHADRLQPIGIARTANQEIAAEADADRRIGAESTVAAGEFATSDPGVGRQHRPRELRLFREAEIHAYPANGRDISLGPSASALEHAFEPGHRADDKADVLAALAFQNTGRRRLLRIGGCERRYQRSNGNTKSRESHGCYLRVRMS